MEGNALHFILRTHVMALYYDLPVFKDVYKLTLLIYSLTKDFSKEYKYTLGQDLKRDAIVLMRSIYKTYNLRKRMLNKHLSGYWWNHVYPSGGVAKFVLKTKPVKHSW